MTKRKKKFDSASKKAFVSLQIREQRSKYIYEKRNSPDKQTSVENIRLNMNLNSEVLEQMKLFGQEYYKTITNGNLHQGRAVSLIEPYDIAVNQSVESLQTKAFSTKRINNSSSKNMKTSEEKASAVVHAQTD